MKIQQAKMFLEMRKALHPRYCKKRCGMCSIIREAKRTLKRSKG